jgi:branched-chain amino acid transport system ATP-binding protein
MIGPVLATRELHKSFGALAVTRGVSLTVAPGELHALIGPNGAGKTTLIAQIMGTLAPASGQVLLDGADITRFAPHRRARLGLARSFQVTALPAELSALETVALAVQGIGPAPLRPFGRAARDETLNAPARAALAAVGLSARAAVPAARLAHGEQRALELACALAMAPRCLVLDEPLAGMGHQEAASIIDLLRGLKRRYAILLVEHDMDAVFALADRVSVLVAGQIIASGPPEAVRADPAVRVAYLGDDTTC